MIELVRRQGQDGFEEVGQDIDVARVAEDHFKYEIGRNGKWFSFHGQSPPAPYNTEKNPCVIEFTGIFFEKKREFVLLLWISVSGHEKARE